MKNQSLHDMLGIQAPPILPTMSGMPESQLSPEVLPPDFFENDDEEFDGQLESDLVDFQENLAENMDSAFLESLSAELVEAVESDLDARQPWMDMIAKVKEQMGIGEDSSYEEPFPGASSVTYPIIVKAQIQFQARALPQIFPNDPAKAVVIGESTPVLEEQADRVADVLNYQIQYLDPGNRKDFRKMLWWLPLTGSTFRYVFHDPLKDINMVRFVPVDDFIVPYGTRCLEDASRFTHRFYDTKNDMMKLQNMGFYLECDLQEDDNYSDDDKDNPVQRIRDDVDGEERTSVSTGRNTAMQECYNIYVDYDLPQYEDLDEEGQPTGIGLPYVVTIHVKSQKVLAIRRNWKQFDNLRQKRIYFAHYQYQEGPGFYGSGLPHLIGSLQEATTGALRSFGDAMAFSLLQGGWKLKDAKMAGDQTMSPGQFQDVDASIDDINKAIKVANFPAPSPQALEYIKMLDAEAQTIVSIQDIMTGDSSPQNSPVGTTLAMIEQASKVITAQHKSLYESFSEELSILSDLNYDFLPDNDNFAMPGKVGVIQRTDFDGSIDVQPTADPSVASFQQRQAIDQATLQIAQIPPFQPFFRDQGFELCRRILKNLGVPSLDEIMITPEEFMQQKQQAQANPPPPSPDQIKAQVMQQDSQVKAQTAQANQAQMQLDQQKMQSDAMMAQMQMKLDAQQQMIDAANKKTELQLQEKQMDMKNASDNKMIDARFLGSVAPTLMEASDSLATEQDSKVLSDDGAKTTPEPAPAQLTPQQQQLHNQAIAATQQHMQNMQPQQPNPKQNILMRLMNKIRGQ